MGHAALANEPTDRLGYRTPTELFDAYKEATNSRDWKRLYKSSTVARQDALFVECAVVAASSGDQSLRELMNKHGIDWRQFGTERSETEQDRFWKDLPTIANRIGKQVIDRETLFCAAQECLLRIGSRTQTVVHELQDLRQEGVRAKGKSIENYVVHGEKGETPRTVRVTRQLSFLQIEGVWYLAADYELADQK